MHRRFLALSVVTTLLLAASAASATPEFPGLIISDLNIKCDGGASPLWDGQGCTVCHLSNNGGLGTAIHPFGVQVKEMGLSAFNDTALASVLKDLSMGDTQCNGIEQLEQCQWQTLADASSLSDLPTCTSTGDGGMMMEVDAAVPINVLYGCSTTTAPASESSSVPVSAAAGLCGLFVFGFVRKRRRRPDV